MISNEQRATYRTPVGENLSNRQRYEEHAFDYKVRSNRIQQLNIYRHLLENIRAQLESTEADSKDWQRI